MNKVNILTDRSFDEEVLNSDAPVLVSFTATWSPPSEKVSQLLRQIAEKQDGLKIAKIDVGGADMSLAANDNPETRERFNIQIFPTLLLFKKGRIAGMLLGEVDGDKLSQWVEEIKNNDASQTMPIEEFPQYAQNYYQGLVNAAQEAQDKRDQRSITLSRRLSMAASFARAAGGFLLPTVIPGPISIALGAVIMGTNGFGLLKTFKNKDTLPQPVQPQNGLLRMAFNMASFAGGAFLASGALNHGPALSAAGLILGLTIVWNALGNFTKDIGKQFRTNIDDYPVEPPKDWQEKHAKKDNPPAPD